MKDVNDRLNEIEDENKILKIKMKDNENENEYDKNKIDVLALEHLSEILLSKTSNGKDLNQSVKFKFSEIFRICKDCSEKPKGETAKIRFF